MQLKFFKWIATSVEDQAGGISSKRLGFYYCLFLLSKAITNPSANEIAIYTIAGLAFGLVGLTIPEWFSQLSNKEKREHK